ncbi:MAG: DMT family transporter [Spirochaetaceae bacterium]|jgi:drug/metabolite transporter (DMT)-like permease|nr:DMT family transporter [Spirochaetaceae bacterium]
MRHPSRYHHPAREGSRRFGQGAVFLCAVLWSTSGLFIKLVNAHPMVISGARSFLAALVLLAFRLLQPPYRGDVLETTGGGRAANPDRLFTLLGGLAYAATMILFVIANKLTSSANAILLQYSAPVWAAVLGWAIAGEKPLREHWAALVLVLLGLFVFFRDSLGGGNILGDIIALISGICFGFNSVAMRRIKHGNPADSMLFAHIITFAVCSPFFFLYTPRPDTGMTLSILFMGIFQIGIASRLFAYGIMRITAVQAMLTAMAEPLLNPVWVLLVTGERPSASALIGGAIIIVSVSASTVIQVARKQ